MQKKYTEISKQHMFPQRSHLDLQNPSSLLPKKENAEPDSSHITEAEGSGGAEWACPESCKVPAPNS